jgi:Acyl-CoA carboxylase epsilon subunit
MAEATPEERRALFHVVRGDPDDAEIAALTAVLAAAASAVPAPPARGPVSTWADPASRLRTRLNVGPGSWRTSSWPR